uniref:Interleukin n=1 Tax=Acanthochromis polyacanthus TaxID=80966 RepID=A0A3Q1EHY4_9TELE
MEHFIRTVFWIFTLSGFLQAAPRPAKSDFRINLMRESVKCLPDSKFYTPENVLDKCITTAVDCVMKELNGTAKVECDGPKDYINLALSAFSLLRKERQDKGYGLTNSTDCVCEKWRQTNFSEFLNKTSDLIDKINSK